MSDTNLLEGLTTVVGLLNKTDDKYYKMSEIRAITGVVIEEPIHEAYLVTVPGDPWLKFGGFEWVCEIDDEVYVRPIFVGYGISESLREMRYTYFGPDDQGYVFYLNIDKTVALLNALKKYFDGD